MNLSDFINSKEKYVRRSHTILSLKDFGKKCSKQALKIKTLELFFFKTILICCRCFFKNNWMPKFNRSLSTTKYSTWLLSVSLHDFEGQSGHYFVTGATGQPN